MCCRFAERLKFERRNGNCVNQFPRNFSKEKKFLEVCEKMFFFCFCFCCHDRRAYRVSDRLRASRIFQNSSKFTTESNKFVADVDETVQFQDLNILLPCFGDCGSKLNKLLLSCTNLKYFKNCHKIERMEDVIDGKGSRECYEKLNFETVEDEKQFCKLLSQFMKKRANQLSMDF